MVEPRAQGRAQAPAGAGAQVVERRQGAGGEVGRQRPVAGVQQQGGQVLVGDHERAAADAAVEDEGVRGAGADEAERRALEHHGGPQRGGHAVERGLELGAPARRLRIGDPGDGQRALGRGDRAAAQP